MNFSVGGFRQIKYLKNSMGGERKFLIVIYAGETLS
jgi:hypothetical protein